MDSSHREDPPLAGTERATLTGFLQFQRDTLAWKCARLTPAQLRSRAVPPSELSLLGLVRHLTDVERKWFTRVIGGADAPAFYWGAADVDFAVEEADVAESFHRWHDECARSRRLVERCASLDQVGINRATGRAHSLRWVLTHMIEEYARHNGHADLLRERLDGRTGE